MSQDLVTPLSMSDTESSKSRSDLVVVLVYSKSCHLCEYNSLYFVDVTYSFIVHYKKKSNFINFNNFTDAAHL